MLDALLRIKTNLDFETNVAIISLSLQNSGAGGGGANSPPKVWFGENLWKPSKNPWKSG